MALEKEVMTQMKAAMKAKDSTALEALRSVKSEILLAKTESDSKELTEEKELQLVQKLVKQRKESAELYKEKGREDLVEVEEKQAEVIAQFLPKQMSEEEIGAEVDVIISETGAEGMQDMGKVMGKATQKMAGKADGKTISKIVREKLK
jgi:hypothetical protein